MTDNIPKRKLGEYLPPMIVGFLLLLALLLALFISSGESKIAENAAAVSSAETASSYYGGYDLVVDKHREKTASTIVSDGTKDAVTFSLDKYGTSYITEPTQLEMYADEGMQIFFTTDGTTPTKYTGVDYTGPIDITPADNIRAYHFAAVAMDEEGNYSDVYYTTYFAGSKEDFEALDTIIFSLDIDEDDLWSAETGIFHEKNWWMRGMDWERKVHIELYDTDGSEVFDMYAGMRLYGNYSRTMVQKPMRFSSRTIYDKLDDFNTLDMFGELYTSEGVRIDRFEDLILRNAGNDFGTAFMRDEVVQTLMTQQGFPVTQPVRPCLVYVNGTLYGLYWIHETYKNNFFENRYEMYDYQGQFVVLDGPEQAKTIDRGIYGIGPLKDYREMYNMNKNDLKVKKHYDNLCDVLDVEGYLQMHATMAYVDNGDWPQNNNRVFKYFAAEGEDFSDVYGMDGRWYFVPHDTDWAFFNDVSNNTLLRNYDKTQIQYSPLFCALMERDDCERTYVTYFLDMMNHAYKPETMASTIRSIASKIRPSIELYLARSPYIADNFDLAAFDRRAERVAVYAENRAEYMKQHLENEYDLTRRWKLTVDVPDGAGVQVNTITKNGDFEGFYYTDYLTYVSPIVPLGYEFDHWLVRDEVVTDFELALDGSGSLKTDVTLVLKPIEQLYIESVSYDDGYIVLCNPCETAVSAKGYAVSDKSGTLRRFTLPDVEVPAGERIVVFMANFNVIGTKAEYLQADFTLKKGETVYFSLLNDETGVQEIIEEVTLPTLHTGSAYVRNMYDKKFYEILDGEELPN